MTQRERIMAGLVVGVVVLGGGTNLLMKNVIAPIREMKSELVRKQQVRARLANELKTGAAVKLAWQDKTAETLAKDPQVAYRAFREDVTRLLDRHGLVDGQSIKPRSLYEYPKGFRKGFIEMPLLVSARGNLQQLVNFLRDFHRRPYLARITRLSINAIDSPVNQRAGAHNNRRGDAEPQLSINMTLTGLVLPELDEVPSVALDLEQIEQTSADRLHAEDYGPVVASNLFKKYVPPPPPPPPPPPQQKPTEVAQAPRPKPMPPPPPPRPDLTLKGTASLNGEPFAFIEQSPGASPDRIFLNDEIDDGRLVLVHPRGVVIRVMPQTGNPPTDYFWPLGKSNKERVELDTQLYPEIAAELTRAFEG